MRRQDLTLLFCASLIALFCLWPALYWIFGDDFIQWQLPFSIFKGAALRAGTIPWWSHELSAGYPLAANLAADLFYPGNVLYALFPYAVATSLLVLSHILLACAGYYLFARLLLKDKTLAFIASALFASGGALAGELNAGYMNAFIGVAWIPWVLYFMEKAVEASPSLRHFALLGAVCGLQFLGGHPQISFIMFCVVAARIVYRSGDKNGVPVRKSALFTGALLGALIFAMLTATKWLPLLEFSGVGAVETSPGKRFAGIFGFVQMIGSASFDEWRKAFIRISGGALFPGNIVGLVFPRPETRLYMGIIPLLLLVYAFYRLRDAAKSVRFYLFAALFSLLLSMGCYSPVYLLGYLFVPGFFLFRNPYRFLWIFLAVTPLLSAWGYARLKAGSPPAGKSYVKTALIFLALLGLALCFNLAYVHIQKSGGSSHTLAMLGYALRAPFYKLGLYRPPGMITSLARPWLFLLLIQIPVFLVVIKKGGTAARWMIAAAILDLALFQWTWMFSSKPLVTLYENGPGRSSVSYGFDHRDLLEKTREGFPGARVFLFPESPELSEVPGMPYYCQPIKIDQCLVTRFTSLRDYHACFELTAQKQLLDSLAGATASGGEFSPAVSAKLDKMGVEWLLTREKSPEESLQLFSEENGLLLYKRLTAKPWIRFEGADSTGAAVRQVALSPGAIRVDYSAARESRLFLAQPWTPGWKASVDHGKIEVQRADGIFSCVDVPAGNGTVTLRFSPWSIRWGKALTLCGILFCGVMLFRFRRRKTA